jgi:hypothetical protein
LVEAKGVTPVEARLPPLISSQVSAPVVIGDIGSEWEPIRGLNDEICLADRGAFPKQEIRVAERVSIQPMDVVKKSIGFNAVARTRLNPANQATLGKPPLPFRNDPPHPPFDHENLQHTARNLLFWKLRIDNRPIVIAIESDNLGADHLKISEVRWLAEERSEARGKFRARDKSRAFTFDTR